MVECIKIVYNKWSDWEKYKKKDEDYKWCGLDEYLKDYRLLINLEYFIKYKKQWCYEINSFPFLNHVPPFSFDDFPFNAPLYIFFMNPKYVTLCRIYKFIYYINYLPRNITSLAKKAIFLHKQPFLLDRPFLRTHSLYLATDSYSFLHVFFMTVCILIFWLLF
jgi:hypothetical protein